MFWTPARSLYLLDKHESPLTDTACPPPNSFRSIETYFLCILYSCLTFFSIWVKFSTDGILTHLLFLDLSSLKSHSPVDKNIHRPICKNNIFIHHKERNVLISFLNKYNICKFKRYLMNTHTFHWCSFLSVLSPVSPFTSIFNLITFNYSPPPHTLFLTP